MSNINILDHHFYFKTQRGRIKSQPINSEVSHYHLRLLLGNKEAPWWWPLKAPYGVFASLGHKSKAWVRGVGFLMFPLEWWSSSRGLTGGVRWRNAVLSTAPRAVPLGAAALLGVGLLRSQRACKVPMLFLATLGPSSRAERVLLHWTSPPVEESAGGQTPNWEWGVAKASLTSPKGRWTIRRTSAWPMYGVANPNQLSPGKKNNKNRKTASMGGIRNAVSLGCRIRVTDSVGQRRPWGGS